MFPVLPDPMDEALRADQAKPRYKGLLGDFFVDWSRVAEYPPCSQPLKPLTLDITTHELYAPGFRVAFPVEHFEGPARECADGSILAMGLSPFVGRRYYVGPAVVPWNAPLDRLVLMTVVGHPAIGLLGIPGWPDMFELFVIQRFPSGTKPGILVIVGRTRTLDEAVTKAEWIIKIGNE